MRKLALLALLPTAAMARVVPHSVAYYVQHPQEWRATLYVCHTHPGWSGLPDCRTAEKVGGIAIQQRTRSADPLSTTQYWNANPVARDGVLAQCNRRSYTDAIVFPYCGVVAQSKAQELSR